MENNSQPQSKLRKLYPKKLYPPPNVAKLLAEREKNKVPLNPVFKFFKLFFGEGF